MEAPSLTAHVHSTTTLAWESVANVSRGGSGISNLTCISQPFSTK